MIKKSTTLLKEILKIMGDKEITLDEFINLLKQRSFAMIILVLSLAQTILIIQPPGFSAVTGIPIALLGLQMMCGRKTIWVPEKLGKKKMPQKALKKVIQWSIPVVSWCEKITKPRWSFMFNSAGKSFIGFMIFILAVILSLPIPGGNLLTGICIALLAFSILQLDGFLAFLSLALSFINMYFMYSLILGAINLVMHGIEKWF